MIHPILNQNGQPGFLDLSQFIFKASFICGTAIFLAHIIFPNLEILFIIGLIHVIIAFVINAIVFIALVIAALMNKQYWQTIILNAILLLVNIPVVMLYMYAVISGFNLSLVYP